MMAGDVLHLDAGGRVSRLHVDELAAIVRPRSAGDVVVATPDEVRVGPDFEELETLARLGLPSTLRLNDGGCDPDGRFLCGSVAYDEAPGAGALYAVSPDGTVTVVAEDISISNGLGSSSQPSSSGYGLGSGFCRLKRLEFVANREAD
jgi:sugar lactone lactonase YvrE